MFPLFFYKISHFLRNSNNTLIFSFYFILFNLLLFTSLYLSLSVSLFALVYISVGFTLPTTFSQPRLLFMPSSELSILVWSLFDQVQIHKNTHTEVDRKLLKNSYLNWLGSKFIVSLLSHLAPLHNIETPTSRHPPLQIISNPFHLFIYLFIQILEFQFFLYLFRNKSLEFSIKVGGNNS